MSPAELERRGRALYGERWQTPLAEALGVTDRTMRRWLAGTFGIPEPIAAEIASLERATKDATAAARRIVGRTYHARVFRG